MGSRAPKYTAVDAVNDYYLWKAGVACGEEFYRTAPKSTPGCVYDYDYGPHDDAMYRLQELKPRDSIGAVLLLEAVIFGMIDEGSEVSVKGLRALQSLFVSKIIRDGSGLINIRALGSQQKAICHFR